MDVVGLLKLRHGLGRTRAEAEGVKKRLGLSLAEVLLAITLFGVVAYALTGVWVTHSRAVEKSQQLFAATQIAEARLTEQMGLGFRAIERSGVTRLWRWVDNVKRAEEYRWEVRVTDTSTGTPDLKHVKVTVEWEERGKKRTVQLVTSVYWQG